jgi:hypothetical protein
MAILLVNATADADQLSAPGTPNRWSATVCEGNFAGVFAHGDSLQEARANLAVAVWLAAKADPALDESTVDAVRILLVTRKTFSAELLEEAAAQ